MMSSGKSKRGEEAGFHEILYLRTPDGPKIFSLSILAGCSEPKSRQISHRVLGGPWLRGAILHTPPPLDVCLWGSGLSGLGGVVLGDYR